MDVHEPTYRGSNMRDRFKRLAVMVAAVVVALGGAVTVASPAAASSVPIVAVPFIEAKLEPSGCDGGFGIYENTSSPWGDYRCYAANVTRNACIVPSGPDRRYFKNDTQYWWRLFRASDTTCSGASVWVQNGTPMNVRAGSVSAHPGWTTFRGVMRTSATWDCPPFDTPSNCP